MRTRLIMGRNSLSECLKRSPERIVEVYTSLQKPLPLLEKMQQAGVRVKRLSKDALQSLVNSDSHQAVVARVKEHEGRTLDFLFEQSPSIILFLDSIQDPQNLGAILRICECFGVGGVVWSKNRSVDLTPSASKASVGASELVPWVKVNNLAQSVEKAQDAGYTVITAEMGHDAQSIYDYDYPEKIVLVLGSEGKGIQKLISKRSDVKLMIPMHGQIDSLSVSQAAAVFLASARRSL